MSAAPAQPFDVLWSLGLRGTPLTLRHAYAQTISHPLFPGHHIAPPGMCGGNGRCARCGEDFGEADVVRLVASGGEESCCYSWVHDPACPGVTSR